MQSTGRRMAIDAEHWSAKSNVVVIPKPPSSATPASLIGSPRPATLTTAAFFKGSKSWARSNGPWGGAWESAAASVWSGSLSQHETQADAANGASFLF